MTEDDIKAAVKSTYAEVLNYIDAEIAPLVILTFEQKDKTGIPHELKYLIEKLYNAFFGFRVKIRDFSEV